MKKIETDLQFKSGLVIVTALTCMSTCVVLYHACNTLNSEILGVISTVMGLLGLLVISIWLVFVSLRNQIDYGFKYAFNHAKLVREISNQLIDSGVYTTIKLGNLKLAKLPWISIKFDDTYSSGTIYIKDSIKFHNKLSEIELSPALGDYVVEQTYFTHDGNYCCYEFYDCKNSSRLVFHDMDEFKSYNNRLDEYELFVDKKTRLRLTHQLIVGQTGSGKSYALHDYLLQMREKKIPYILYFADPKESSIYLLGKLLAKENTASDFDDIVTLLEQFVLEMKKRQLQMKEYLLHKIDGDYRDFGLSPQVLIFDEYADFSLLLQTKDKKLRDHVTSLVSQIVLKGRQSGFFIWIVMQQAGSNNIPTFIRDNLPWKVVLGNAEDQTYVTAFGAGVDIPNKKMEIGEGVYTYPAMADKPRLCVFPTIKFDVIKELEAGVM